MTQYPIKNNFDLEERTARFGEEIIRFCRTSEKDIVTRPLIDQLIRSGTSIGANYCEANNASSRKDFRNKIFICKKEAQETRHWLRMIKEATGKERISTEKILQECQELIMIFQKITSSLDKEQ